MRIWALRGAALALFVAAGYIAVTGIRTGQPFWSTQRSRLVNLYAWPSEWQANGEATPMRLARLRGQSAVATFAYLKCRTACPMIWPRRYTRISRRPASRNQRSSVAPSCGES